MQNYMLNKNSNAKYDIKQSTVILQQYGISHNEKKTRELIVKGKLRGKIKGNNPNDKRQGYEVTEKALYEIVVSEIPIMKDILEEYFEKMKPKQTTSKIVKKEGQATK